MIIRNNNSIGTVSLPRNIHCYVPIFRISGLFDWFCTRREMIYILEYGICWSRYWSCRWGRWVYGMRFGSTWNLENHEYPEILLSDNHLYIFLCSAPDPLSGSLCYPVFGSCECLSMTGKSEHSCHCTPRPRSASGTFCQGDTYNNNNNVPVAAAAALGDTRVIVVARTHVRTSESNRIESNLSLPLTRRPRLIFTVADAAAAAVVIVL